MVEPRRAAVGNMHAGHGFKSTTIEWHPDGSALVHHKHEVDENKDNRHAAVDLDSVHDSLEDNIRCPEEIETELSKHGVDPEILEEKIAPGIHKDMQDILK